MLEQLFGSRTRGKILKLFFEQSEQKLYVREICRLIKERLNSVRRELLNLEKLGLIKSQAIGQKKYFFLDNEFVLLSELKSLIIKSRMLLERNLVNRVKSLKGIKYFALTGFFVKDDSQKTDLLIVGNLSKTKLDKIIKSIERSFDQEFRYTYLTNDEYNFRKEITDRFLYNIVNGKKIVVIDKLKMNG